MSNPPRIWLDYRPVRIGWVIANQDVPQLLTAAAWNACLWGGRHNCIIPAHDPALADRLIECFGIDVLIPVQADDATTAYIGRFPHLQHHRWHDTIFDRRGCEFADIRHVLRRIVANQDNDTRSRIILPVWEDSDNLHPLLTMMIGRYPVGDSGHIPDYKAGVRRAFTSPEVAIAPTSEIPTSLLDSIRTSRSHIV